MRKFQILPHTADVRLKIEADSPEELFSAASDGMNQILKKNFPSVPPYPVKQTLSLTAPDITTLLIDFLSQLLTFSYTKQAIFSQIEFKQLTPTFLCATLLGKKVKGFDEEIKAVTYHEAKVSQNQKGNLETTIIFDI